jgi:hypothetical protein
VAPRIKQSPDKASDTYVPRPSSSFPSKVIDTKTGERTGEEETRIEYKGEKMKQRKAPHPSVQDGTSTQEILEE